MSTLILDNKSLGLTVDGGALVIREAGARAATVPIKSLQRLVIHGDADLSAALLGKLAEAGVGVLLLAKRNLRRRAVITGPLHNDLSIRVGQALRLDDIDFRQRWSSRLVAAKLRRQHRHLIRALARRPQARKPLLDSIRRIEAAIPTTASADLAGLLGIEGAAARSYFQALAAILPPSLNFKGRNRRPPRDPVNATLSLGYTLLHFDAVRAAHIAGLDPLIGFYHRPVHGRESLASDLIEPLRPAVDAFVLDLFREKNLRAEHFEHRDQACLLNKTGRSHFYPAWEQRAPSLRKLLLKQSRTIAKIFQADGTDLLESFETEDWDDQ